MQFFLDKNLCPGIRECWKIENKSITFPNIPSFHYSNLLFHNYPQKEYNKLKILVNQGISAYVR